MNSAQPFSCAECNQRPRSDFTIYPEVDDWLVAYPERNLMHIHFGSSTQSADVSVGQAQFHLAWLQSIVAQYPKKHFFFTVDMSRKDDSEFFEPEAKRIYKVIRSHPQLDAAAVYGQTHAMKFLMNLFIRMGGARTTLVDTKEQADAIYQAWYERYTKNHSTEE